MQAKEQNEDVLGMTAEAAMKQSPAVVTAYNGFQAEVDKLKNAKAEGEKIKENIQQCWKQVESDINTAFAKLHKMLDKRKNVLLSQTCDAAVSKETRLAIQLEGLHQLETAMNECHDLSKKAKSQADWSQVKVRAEQLLHRFSETSLELCENATILTEVQTDQVCADIESFGYVATGACPSKCIVPDPPPFGVVGKEMTFSVQTCSASGQRLGHGEEVVRGVLAKAGEAETRVMATTRDVGDGSYHLSIKPKVIGEHSLSVSVHGQHLESSPFVVQVTRDYVNLKNPIQKISDQVH